jgi:hypothetical protein
MGCDKPDRKFNFGYSGLPRTCLLGEFIQLHAMERVEVRWKHTAPRELANASYGRTRLAKQVYPLRDPYRP